jgi:hypothetical protein
MFLDLLKNPWIFLQFGIFGDLSELFLYRKYHGSDMWIIGPRLALGPW